MAIQAKGVGFSMFDKDTEQQQRFRDKYYKFKSWKAVQDVILDKIQHPREEYEKVTIPHGLQLIHSLRCPQNIRSLLYVQTHSGPVFIAQFPSYDTNDMNVWLLDKISDGTTLTKVSGVKAQFIKFVYIPVKCKFVAICKDMSLRLFGDVQNNFVEYHKVEIPTTVFCLVYIRDIDEVLVGGNGMVTSWKIEKIRNYLTPGSKFVFQVKKNEWVMDMKVDSTNKQVLLLTDSSVYVVNYKTNRCTYYFQNKHAMSFSACAFYPQRDFFLTASKDGVIKVWSLVFFNQQHEFVAHSDQVTALDLHSTDPLLFSASLDGTVKVWRLDTFELYQRLDCGEKVLNMQVLMDGRLMYQGLQTVKVWEFNHFYGMFANTNSEVERLCRTSAKGLASRIVVVANDGGVRLMSPLTGDIITIIYPMTSIEVLQQITYDRKDNRVYALMNCGDIVVFGCSTNPCVALHTLVVPSRDEEIKCLALLKRDRALGRDESVECENLVFAGTKSGQIVLVNSWRCTMAAPLQAHGADVVHLTSSTSIGRVDEGLGNCDRLLSCDSLNTLKIWGLTLHPEIATEIVLTELKKVTLTSHPIHICMLGATLAYSAASKLQMFWVSSSEKQKSSFAGGDNLEGFYPIPMSEDQHDGPITGIDCSATLQIFLTVSEDSSIKIWDRSGQLVREMCFDGPVKGCCFANERGDILVGYLSQICSVNVERYLPLSRLERLVINNIHEDIYEESVVFDHTLQLWRIYPRRVARVFAHASIPHLKFDPDTLDKLPSNLESRREYIAGRAYDLANGKELIEDPNNQKAKLERLRKALTLYVDPNTVPNDRAEQRWTFLRRTMFILMAFKKIIEYKFKKIRKKRVKQALPSSKSNVQKLDQVDEGQSESDVASTDGDVVLSDKGGSSQQMADVVVSASRQVKKELGTPLVFSPVDPAKMRPYELDPLPVSQQELDAAKAKNPKYPIAPDGWVPNSVIRDLMNLSIPDPVLEHKVSSQLLLETHPDGKLPSSSLSDRSFVLSECDEDDEFIDPYKKLGVKPSRRLIPEDSPEARLAQESVSPLMFEIDKRGVSDLEIVPEHRRIESPPEKTHKTKSPKPRTVSEKTDKLKKKRKSIKGVSDEERKRMEALKRAQEEKDRLRREREDRLKALQQEEAERRRRLKALGAIGKLMNKAWWPEELRNLEALEGMKRGDIVRRMMELLDEAAKKDPSTGYVEHRDIINAIADIHEERPFGSNLYKDTVAKFQDHLGHASALIRVGAMQGLGRMGLDKKIIMMELLEHLTDKDYNVRMTAADILGKYEGFDTVQGLKDMLYRIGVMDGTRPKERAHLDEIMRRFEDNTLTKGDRHHLRKLFYAWKHRQLSRGLKSPYFPLHLHKPQSLLLTGASESSIASGKYSKTRMKLLPVFEPPKRVFQHPPYDIHGRKREKVKKSKGVDVRMLKFQTNYKTLKVTNVDFGAHLRTSDHHQDIETLGTRGGEIAFGRRLTVPIEQDEEKQGRRRVKKKVADGKTSPKSRSASRSSKKSTEPVEEKEFPSDFLEKYVIPPSVMHKLEESQKRHLKSALHELQGAIDKLEASAPPVVTKTVIQHLQESDTKAEAETKIVGQGPKLKVVSKKKMRGSLVVDAALKERMEYVSGSQLPVKQWPSVAERRPMWKHMLTVQTKMMIQKLASEIKTIDGAKALKSLIGEGSFIHLLQEASQFTLQYLDLRIQDQIIADYADFAQGRRHSDAVPELLERRLHAFKDHLGEILERIDNHIPWCSPLRDRFNCVLKDVLKIGVDTEAQLIEQAFLRHLASQLKNQDLHEMLRDLVLNADFISVLEEACTEISNEIGSKESMSLNIERHAGQLLDLVQKKLAPKATTLRQFRAELSGDVLNKIQTIACEYQRLCKQRDSGIAASLVQRVLLQHMTHVLIGQDKERLLTEIVHEPFFRKAFQRECELVCKEINSENDLAENLRMYTMETLDHVAARLRADKILTEKVETLLETYIIAELGECYCDDVTVERVTDKYMKSRRGYRRHSVVDKTMKTFLQTKPFPTQGSRSDVQSVKAMKRKIEREVLDSVVDEMKTDSKLSNFINRVGDKVAKGLAKIFTEAGANNAFDDAVVMDRLFTTYFGVIQAIVERTGRSATVIKEEVVFLLKTFGERKGHVPVKRPTIVIDDVKLQKTEIPQETQPVEDKELVACLTELLKRLKDKKLRQQFIDQTTFILSSLEDNLPAKSVTTSLILKQMKCFLEDNKQIASLVSPEDIAELCRQLHSNQVDFHGGLTQPELDKVTLLMREFMKAVTVRTTPSEHINIMGQGSSVAEGVLLDEDEVLAEVIRVPQLQAAVKALGLDMFKQAIEEARRIIDAPSLLPSVGSVQETYSHVLNFFSNSHSKDLVQYFIQAHSSQKFYTYKKFKEMMADEPFPTLERMPLAAELYRIHKHFTAMAELSLRKAAVLAYRFHVQHRLTTRNTAMVKIGFEWRLSPPLKKGHVITREHGQDSAADELVTNNIKAPSGEVSVPRLPVASDTVPSLVVDEIDDEVTTLPEFQTRENTLAPSTQGDSGIGMSPAEQWQQTFAHNAEVRRKLQQKQHQLEQSEGHLAKSGRLPPIQYMDAAQAVPADAGVRTLQSVTVKPPNTGTSTPPGRTSDGDKRYQVMSMPARLGTHVDNEDDGTSHFGLLQMKWSNRAPPFDSDSRPLGGTSREPSHLTSVRGGSPRTRAVSPRSATLGRIEKNGKRSKERLRQIAAHFLPKLKEHERQLAAAVSQPGSLAAATRHSDTEATPLNGEAPPFYEWDDIPSLGVHPLIAEAMETALNTPQHRRTTTFPVLPPGGHDKYCDYYRLARKKMHEHVSTNVKKLSPRLSHQPPDTSGTKVTGSDVSNLTPDVGWIKLPSIQ